MAITTLNNLSINRSDTAAADQLWTATSATATDFQAAAAGGSWVLIKSQSITSATADMDFVNGTADVIFDATYKVYVLLISDLLVATDNNKLEVRITTDTGSTFKTSGYTTVGYESYYVSGGSQGNQNNAETNSMLSILKTLGNEADQQAHGYMWFFNPANTASLPTCESFFCYGQGSSNNTRFISGVGSYNTAGAYDGFKLILNSGDIATMEASLYGIST